LRTKAIKDEADRLVREQGVLALEVAAEKLKSARKRKNARLERFLTQVIAELKRRALKQLPTEKAA
jgi:hypothetical protein